MDRIAESGDRCVEVWKEHVSGEGVKARGVRDNEPTASSSSPSSNNPLGGNNGATGTESEDVEPNDGGSELTELDRRITIGGAMNSGLQTLVSTGRGCTVDELVGILKAAGVFGNLQVQANLLMEIYGNSSGGTAGSLSQDELNLLLRQITTDERGAPFWKQVVMAHNRSLKQQLNKSVSLLIEFGTVSFAGALMGFAAKNPYTGILVSPYTLISPANQVVLVPMSAMFVGMAVGLSAAPTGVDSFGSELVVYWREASVGHNKLAYFVGKTVSNFYRIFIGALHFCAWYLLLAETILNPMQLYSVVTVLFFSVYGMACVVSMILPIDTANLVAVVLALLIPVFGGFVRNLGMGVKQSMYSWWANEAFFSYSIKPYEHLFLINKTAHVWSYTLDQAGKDFTLVILIGVLYRVVAFFCMVGLNKEKQS
jgi:hypothetical protein